LSHSQLRPMTQGNVLGLLVTYKADNNAAHQGPLHMPSLRMSHLEIAARPILAVF